MKFKQKIRDRILDVAESLFNKYGYCAVGVDTICEQSDVSKATMYKYFSNKEGLIEQVLLRRDLRFRDQLTQVVESGQTPWGKIEGIFNWHLDWFKSSEFTGCMFVEANSEFFHLNQNIIEIVYQHKKWLEVMIHSCLDQSKANKKELAQVIMTVLEGMISYSAVFGVKDGFIAEARVIQHLIDRAP